MKRLFDVTVSSIALVVLSPVLLLLIWIVRLNSEGPGLFRQIRIAKNGGTFVCYKLRTMKTGTPHRPSHEVSKTSVTSLGGFLRRTKLDEIPQLYNVIRGEMSLVGPRPCLPSQSALIEARRISGALFLKPGITGPAQIQGIDMSDPGLLAKVDGEYAYNRSFAGDLSLIWRTITGSGRGKDRLAPNPTGATIFNLHDPNSLFDAIGARSKIIVSGASGFIGKEFLEVASQRSNTAVIGLFRGVNTATSVHCLPVIVDDYAAVTLDEQLSNLFRGAKAIVHLAAVTPASRLQSDLVQTNVEFTRRLAMIAGRVGAHRFVFISSARVHGELTESVPFSEKSPLKAVAPYARSKILAEAAIVCVAQDTGLPFTIIRPPVVYGPGIKGKFRALAKAVASGMPLPFGRITSNRRDLIGVRNLAMFIDKSLDHQKTINEVFLINDGATMSTRAIVEAMAQSCSLPLRLFPLPEYLIRRLSSLVGLGAPVERLIGNFEIDCSKAREAIAWESPEPPPFDIRRMMKSLLGPEEK
jgi:O-antigen biosynthesis protein WbqP